MAKKPKREANKQRRVTEWLDPDEVFLSQYGLVLGSEWLRREQQRIEDQGGGATVIVRQGSMVALTR
jgi:hypothetical protein